MTSGPPSATAMPDDRGLEQSIDDLHRVCGVYTTPTVAGSILDNVGWRATADLTDARLIEPSAGDGAFLVPAAKRLVASFRSRDIEPTIARLRLRITAFELHPGAASEARNRVRTALREMRVHHGTAAACAKAWIRNADFLLSDQPAPDHTHAVGNPPYVRWSRIPARLKSIYDSRLPRHVTRGDLFLPFLDRAFRSLKPGGKCGLLCSDRWMYMAFGERFRQEWMPWLDILSNDSVNASDVFEQRVDTYPTILVASKRPTPKTQRRPILRRASRTLDDLGYAVKAGPALGHAPAFVLRPDEDDVESELLRPWIESSDVLDGSIEWSGRRVVILFDDDGRLHDLRHFPRLQRRLRRFTHALRGRWIVRNGAPWYRTIDRIRPADWTRPKLLVPELAKVPRIAVDRSGAVPSHGIYAIFAPDDRIDDLYGILRNGGLARALDGIAPRLKGNYARCYKRFLREIPISIREA